MSATDLMCQELVELITDYFEGVLPLAKRQRFEMHLAECEGCRAYLAQMWQTVNLMSQLTSGQVRPETRAALLQLFRDWKKNAP